MKKILAFAMASIMALSVLASCGKKEEGDSLKRVQEKGKYVVGLDDSFPPMGYRDKNDEIVGFDIDLAREVAKKMGIEVEFQPVVWDNIVQEVNNRNVDVIWNGCTITEKRKESFDFSNPYLYNKQFVVVMNNSEYNALEDLAGKKAAIQDGSSANNALDNHSEFKDSLAEIVGYEKNDRALQDLMSGGVDCVIVDATVFAYYNELEPNTFRYLEQDLGSEEFGIAFHKEDDTFREALQKALDECEAEGITKELSEKWLYTDATKK